MKRLASLIAIACVLTFGALNIRAQEEPKRKTPKLTMDNLESGKMVAPSDKNPGEAETKPATPAPRGPVSVNPRKLLENTFAQLEKVQSLRMRIKLFNLQNEEREIVIETVRPNRMRMRMGSTGIELITIGSTVYGKTANEPWKTTTTNELAMTEAFNPKEWFKMALNTPGISMSAWAIGEEILAGTPMTVYEITTEERGKSNQVISSSIRMWIGKSDELPRKMEISSPSSGMKMSVSYSDFNTNIVINAPQM